MSTPVPTSRCRGSLTRFLAFVALAVAVLASGAAHPTFSSSTSAPAQAARRAPEQAPRGSCVAAACHGALIDRKNVHAPAKDDCLTCHQQDGTAHTFTLVSPRTQLCVGCHEVATPADTFVHGPVAVGECVTCHDPHASDLPKLVRKTGVELCQVCHVEMTQAMAEHRFTHAPVKADCTSCHSPHASPLRYQLKRSGAELCATCHQAVIDAATKAPVHHDALTMDRQCLNCHAPHTADLPAQLRATTRTLCLSCHNKEVTTPTGPIMNLAEWLAKNPDVHGPIRQDDCSACHQPHGSAQFRLLRKDYPPHFYSPFDPKNYELCFTCHEPDLVQVARTTTLTGFRQGDRNLHFVHVNRRDKGRTCRACHEVHSSQKPKHIRDAVPFGSWALPINYETQPDGGRCAPGCHKAYEYRRTIGPSEP